MTRLETVSISWADPEGGGGGQGLPEQSQKYRISKQSGPDALKNHKSAKVHTFKHEYL